MMSGANDPRRAEFPPTRYWRRWSDDAPPPVFPQESAPAPLADLRPEQVARPAADGQASERPWRVLIVEDDPSQGLFAESVLHGTGMETQLASVTSEVMSAMEDFRPDLVLMDLHMPGMDGAELTTLIRNHPELGRTPIVFLTGDPDPERQFDVLDIGADDFLAKPVRPRHLVTTVQNRLRRTRALQAPPGDALHPLTGLHTRQHMFQCLTEAIPQTRQGALYFLEIEGIAILRNRYGYAALETMLTDAGRCLGDLVQGRAASRLNDNTFLVFAPDLADGDLIGHARQLRDGLAEHEFEIAGQRLRLRALIGYARLARGFEDAGSALTAAEQALRAARQEAFGIAEWEPPAPDEQPQDQALAGHVARALESGTGFELAFQPIVAVAGGDEARYQTLLRLRIDDDRLYSAAEILPIVEASALMHDVDRHVLELAIDTLRRHREEGHALRLFVTQSPRSLVRDGYAQWLLDNLEIAGVEGASLVVDVRQDDAVIHAVSLQEFCSAMVPAGVQLCLSQYSPDAESNALLAQLPMGFVRLAPRFSSQLGDSRVRDEMRAAIEHAHRLGLLVVGQQVEDPQAAATLWMSGVDFIQGNLVQRATSVMDFDFQNSVL